MKTNEISKIATHIDSMIELAGLKKKSTYTTGKVAKIFGVTLTTIVYWCNVYEPKMEGANPLGLAHFKTIGGHRRISHKALEDFMERNDGYERNYG